MHTVYSDGGHTPLEVARFAREAGVQLLAFTDHDSMEGEEEKRAAASACGLTFVQGWEVSSYTPQKVHVLGLNCVRGQAYERFLAARWEGARVRAADMIERANKLFSLSLTLEDAEALHEKKSAPLHTMHVVKAYARALGAEDYGALYERYFERGKPAFSGLCRPTPLEAVEVIHASGGIAVLAHPARIRMGEEARRGVIRTLVEAGLDGIECYHSTHTEEETAYFLRIAKEHGLLVSGGSDFHVLGRGRTVGLPRFEADERLLAALGIPS